MHCPTFQSQLHKNQDIDTQVYVGKLDTLIQSFNSWYHDFDQCRLLMKHFAYLFSVSVDDLSAEYQLELTDLQASDELCAIYRKNSLLDFYKTLRDTFDNLKENALVHTSMYCCEQAFSHMKLNTNNTRNQLTDDHLEAVLRLSTSNIKPDISKLIDDMQHHPSH
ncbi:general transcription factor II-I repeat domain-containing protein 2A-like isoform X1 [Tachypleus tridentatus]|uniref:general transcription factor II-I repeat domain-containing protein 2A-like isoform X1 n=1 Tax=Tachypleus tridentatus TaxID=6853 RepID=UPI003FD2D084